ncbi:MAG: LacI family DNA-binding transcriptional regulator [Verrucomicrobiae bacterium]|nr:LacI family DNA-binding transcriptional regulator [Verrucomicrobiae bacterium]
MVFTLNQTRLRPTRNDVARLAGVSNATVSNVLNRSKAVPISSQTREKVLKAAQEIGYLRNRVAASLIQQKTHTIGVVISSIQGSFHSAVLEGIEKKMASHDYQVMLVFSDDESSFAQQTKVLLERCIDGLILTGNCASEYIRRWAEMALRERMPVALVDQRLADQSVDSVISDDCRGAMMATDHLLKLGHRRIGHVFGNLSVFTAQNRKRGYCDALRNAGIELDERLLVGGSWDIDKVYHEVERLIDSPLRPTAFFAANDRLAAAVLRAMMKRGLRVPGDIAVVGYGDTETSQDMALSTVSQDAEKMGWTVAERMQSRLLNPDLDVREILLPTQLVIRETCGPAAT